MRPGGSERFEVNKIGNHRSEDLLVALHIGFDYDALKLWSLQEKGSQVIRLHSPALQLKAQQVGHGEVCEACEACSIIARVPYKELDLVKIQ